MATIGYGYGSEWHLLQYLGRRRDAFTRTIEDLTRVSSIHWQDHTETGTSTDAPEVRELVGLEFLDPQHPARQEWERRWPQGGAVHNWDAVGQGLTHDHQTWILIEAKAHTGELKSSCGATNPESLHKIRNVLDATRRDLQVTVETDWTRPYYQCCNRIALLHFLVKHGVDAHLTFVYFMGDRSDLGSAGRDCPANRQNWQVALDTQDHHVGVPADSPIRARIHRTFLPVYHAQIDERVLRPEYCRSGTLEDERPPTQVASQSPPPRDLVDAFDQAMIQIYVQAKQQANYTATRFHQMLIEHGGVETARRLLPRMSDGFTELWRRGRLDLTVEALVLQPRWASLFSGTELEMARGRLKECERET